MKTKITKVQVFNADWGCQYSVEKTDTGLIFKEQYEGENEESRETLTTESIVYISKKDIPMIIKMLKAAI